MTLFGAVVCSEICRHQNYKKKLNLEEYFLHFSTKQKEFKCSVKGTKQYESIVEYLKKNMTLPHLPFTAFLVHQFETYLATFQSEKPSIHTLFHGMTSLIVN